MSRRADGEIGLINRSDALRGAKDLVAPEKWVDSSYSSLENHARTQKPAPPR